MNAPAADTDTHAVLSRDALLALLAAAYMAGVRDESRQDKTVREALQAAQDTARESARKVFGG